MLSNVFLKVLISFDLTISAASFSFVAIAYINPDNPASGFIQTRKNYFF